MIAPPIDSKKAREIGDLLEKSAKEIRKREEDRRCLRGEFAPEKGVCAVCGGQVLPKIVFPWDGRMGGPPSQAHVERWHCEACGLMYAKPPKPKATP